MENLTDSTMKAVVRKGDDYHTKFDTAAYLKTVYDHFLDVDFGRNCLNMFHQFINEDDIKGFRMLDLTCGPSVCNEIAAPSRFTEIVLAEFVEGNRDAVRRWLRGDEGAYDCTPYFEFFAIAGGISNVSTWQTEKTASIRQSVKDVVYCDVRKENPLEPLEMEPFDLVITTFSLEQASSDMENYRQVVKNACSLVKHGGYIIIMSTLRGTQYKMGDETFHVTSVGEDDVKDALTTARIEVIKMSTIDGEWKDGVNDFAGVYIVKGRKVA